MIMGTNPVSVSSTTNGSASTPETFSFDYDDLSNPYGWGGIRIQAGGLIYSANGGSASNIVNELNSGQNAGQITFSLGADGHTITGTWTSNGDQTDAVVLENMMLGAESFTLSSGSDINGSSLLRDQGDGTSEYPEITLFTPRVEDYDAAVSQGNDVRLSWTGNALEANDIARVTIPVSLRLDGSVTDSTPVTAQLTAQSNSSSTFAVEAMSTSLIANEAKMEFTLHGLNFGQTGDGGTISLVLESGATSHSLTANYAFNDSVASVVASLNASLSGGSGYVISLDGTNSSKINISRADGAEFTLKNNDASSSGQWYVNQLDGASVNSINATTSTEGGALNSEGIYDEVVFDLSALKSYFDGLTGYNYTVEITYAGSETFTVSRDDLATQTTFTKSLASPVNEGAHVSFNLDMVELYTEVSATQGYIDMPYEYRELLDTGSDELRVSVFNNGIEVARDGANLGYDMQRQGNFVDIQLNVPSPDELAAFASGSDSSINMTGTILGLPDVSSFASVSGTASDTDGTPLGNGPVTNSTGVAISGTNDIVLEVRDGSTVLTSSTLSYELDTAAPTVSLINETVANVNDDVTVQSTETGFVYLIDDSADDSLVDLADILALSDSQFNRAAITTADTATSVSTEGLAAGTYVAYAMDEAGNLSAVSGTSVTVTGSAPANSADAVFQKIVSGGGTDYTDTANPVDDSSTNNDSTPDIIVELVDMAIGDELELWIDGVKVDTHEVTSSDLTAGNVAFNDVDVAAVDSGTANHVDISLKVTHTIETDEVDTWEYQW